VPKPWRSREPRAQGGAAWKPGQKRDFLRSDGLREGAEGLWGRGREGRRGLFSAPPLSCSSRQRPALLRGLGCSTSGLQEEKPGRGHICRRCWEQEGRPHPRFPARCSLRCWPRSFTRRKKKIPVAECESQTRGRETEPAPGPPASPPACWEAARFGETGTPETATWPGEPSWDHPASHHPLCAAPWRHFAMSPLPFASPAALVSSSPTYPVPADPSPKHWVLQAMSLPCSGPRWIWHPAWKTHPESVRPSLLPAEGMAVSCCQQRAQPRTLPGGGQSQS